MEYLFFAIAPILVASIIGFVIVKILEFRRLRDEEEEFKRIISLIEQEEAILEHEFENTEFVAINGKTSELYVFSGNTIIEMPLKEALDYEILGEL